MLSEYEKIELEAEITAYNRVHAHAKSIQGKFCLFFEQHLHKQIINNDLYLKKVIKERMPDYSNEFVRILQYTTQYMLTFQLTTSQYYKHYKEGNIYKECYLTIGEIQNQILTRIEWDFKLDRCDYTLEEMIEKYHKYEEAKKIFKEAEGNLFPFTSLSR